MEFVFYRDVFGGWRWEVRDEKGQLRDSPQSYDTREDCIEAANKARLADTISSEDTATKREPLILCVQPDPELRESLQRALADYQTVLASNSLEAIRLVNASVFDAYVIDYALPGSSGIHLCRHIRRTDPHTPISFYTAAGSEEQRTRAFKAGASAYVCASAGPEALCDELRTLLKFAELQSLRAKVDE
jgi:CheY-like chemotaxis protein